MRLTGALILDRDCVEYDFRVVRKDTDAMWCLCRFPFPRVLIARSTAKRIILPMQTVF